MFKSTSFGIDKLTLSTSEFDVSNNVWLNISPNLKKSGETEIQPTYLFNSPNGDGELITNYGTKAFINTDKYNLTIKPYGNKIQSVLQMNPSKFYSELTIDSNQINDMVMSVHNDLKDKGIFINLDSALTSRLDLSVDAQLNYKFREYADLIQGKTELKRTNSIDYKDTKTFGTGKQTMQFSTYDKGKENEVQLYGKPISDSTNRIRFESRIFKSRGIKNIIGEADTYNKLLETPKKAFNRAYLHVINHHIQINQTQLNLDVTAVVDVLKMCQTKNPKKWFEIACFSVFTSIDDKGTAIDTMRLAIELMYQGNDKRQLRSKWLKQLDTLLIQSSFIRNRLNKESEELRYLKQRELFDTFILPFAV
jgi:hypothetical protein